MHQLLFSLSLIAFLWECHRNMLKEERREQAREEWYDHQGRYDGRDYDEESYHERYEYHNESTIFNPKLDILDFEGMIQPDGFINWLNMVEKVFDYYDPLDHKKVKLVVVKLHKNDSFCGKI